MIMCMFKIIAVTDWGLYQEFHGCTGLDAYAEYLAGLVFGVGTESGHRAVGMGSLQESGKASGASAGGGGESGKFIQPDFLILREKNLPEQAYMELLIKLLGKCRYFNGQGKRAGILAHTHLLAARQAGCNGIHLPFPLFEKYYAEQVQVPEGRSPDREYGSSQILRDCHGGISAIENIGVSVHSREEAEKAEAMGASYLTAGHIFPTSCKKGLPGRGLGFLEELCASVSIPVYAIGGIHPENLHQIRGAGAAGACMMSEYMKGSY